MRQVYLTHLPVNSDKIARMLEKESSWAVLQTIRKSGLDGRTVKEIADELNESVSTVYGAISALEREGYIKGVKPTKLKLWGRHTKKQDEDRKGKVAKRYFEACELRTGGAHRNEGEPENPWGDVIFSNQFYDKVGNLIQNTENFKKLQEALIQFVSGFCKEKIPAESEKIKDVLPSAEKCHGCEKSHEGHEFVKAILLYTATQVIDSEEIKGLMKELGYTN
ncbi:MAG TPA: winged helix-turn-helix domain-containing protein [archaeon]|nr:winged helix-turn-helix domain-containing protein [archaeon]